jgi:hypothetical protein
MALYRDIYYNIIPKPQCSKKVPSQSKNLQLWKSDSRRLRHWHVHHISLCQINRTIPTLTVFKCWFNKGFKIEAPHLSHCIGIVDAATLVHQITWPIGSALHSTVRNIIKTLAATPHSYSTPTRERNRAETSDSFYNRRKISRPWRLFLRPVVKEDQVYFPSYSRETGKSAPKRWRTGINVASMRCVHGYPRSSKSMLSSPNYLESFNRRLEQNRLCIVLPPVRLDLSSRGAI